ncbi:MAG: hypothetical protein AB8B58_07670 [Roseobacter sp.]
MEFSTQQDINAPTHSVFAFLCDFEAFEREAVQRDITVQRIATAPRACVGSAWSAKARFFDKAHDLQIELTELVPDHRMALDVFSKDLKGRLTIDIEALPQDRSRLRAVVQAHPQTFSARILLRSAKVMRIGLDKRFDAMVAGVVRRIEARPAQQP